MICLPSNRRAALQYSFVFMFALALIYGFSLANRSKMTSHASPKVASRSGLDVGERAPSFTLSDTTAKFCSLRSFQGRSMVLGFFCGCDRCHSAAVQIASLQKSGKLQPFVAVVAMNPDGAKEFQRSTGLQGTILVDPSDATATRYKSDFCPRFWELSPTQTIVYRSNIALEGAELQTALHDLATLN